MVTANWRNNVSAFYESNIEDSFQIVQEMNLSMEHKFSDDYVLYIAFQVETFHHGSHSQDRRVLLSDEHDFQKVVFHLHGFLLGLD